MMLRTLIAILFGACLLTSSALAQEYSKEYYRLEQVEAPDVVRQCKVSLSQEALESHLREVGAPWNDFKPSINWAEYITIIIAPNRTKTDNELAFKKLEWDGDLQEDGIKGWFVLHWGWNAVPKQNRVSTRVDTVGTQKKPQIIIVVVKRNLHKPTNRLRCQEDK